MRIGQLWSVALLGAAPVAGHAEVVLDTGLRPAVALVASYDDIDGEFDDRRDQAGRFTLTRGATITGVTVWYAGLGEGLTIMPSLGSAVDGDPAHRLWTSGTASLITPITDPAYGPTFIRGALSPRQLDYTGLSFRIEAGTYWLGNFAINGPDFGKRSILYAGTGTNVVATRVNFGQWTNRSGQQVALRLSGTLDAAGPGVPEPASWALMIIGLGATGLATRRRRVAG